MSYRNSKDVFLRDAIASSFRSKEIRLDDDKTGETSAGSFCTNVFHRRSIAYPRNYFRLSASSEYAVEIFSTSHVSTRNVFEMFAAIMKARSHDCVLERRDERRHSCQKLLFLLKFTFEHGCLSAYVNES